ncbi:hypothetical protein SDJN02_02782, partial [Cucurbita argyrosperma subsp. argyrosperma]
MRPMKKIKHGSLEEREQSVSSSDGAPCRTRHVNHSVTRLGAAPSGFVVLFLTVGIKEKSKATRHLKE